ncbi:hypothetical protein BDW74DRAFT_179765 [Aspergillus multicolor]|uniref:fungal specific transcription factor domain-containing protein n=1 Tax=Aspergillus multicolor TaxID=41759 RepID=UPI003CCE317F
MRSLYQATSRRPPSAPHPTSTWDVFGDQAPIPTNSQQPERNQRGDHRAPVPLDGEQATLLRKYQSGIATWIDLFDEEQHFQRQLPKDALLSPLLANAICAMTAKQVSLVDGAWRTQSASAAGGYYGEALTHLIKSLGNGSVSVDGVLAATILLSSYELLACPGLDHRRHVSGALTLIRTHGCNAASDGLAGAAFWVYARQDVAMALVHECPTMLPPEDWGVSWTVSEERDDRLGNQMVWFLAKVIAYTYGKAKAGVALTDPKGVLEQDLRTWYEALPLHFTGVKIRPAPEESERALFFASPSTAAATCMYHLAHILLLVEGCNAESPVNPEVRSIIHTHAESILTICSSSLSDGALVQAVQALYFAAKHTDIIRTRLKIWAILERIETHLGFHTGNRIKQLEQLMEEQART